MADPDAVSNHGASSGWDAAERIAKLLSLVAIPVVLALVGWLIQSSLADRNVSQEYVKLAVTILKEPRDKGDPLLRSWAADLLNQNSPTKFGADVLRALKEGESVLPAQIAALLAGGGALASSPDGTSLATGHADGNVRIWDSRTGMLRQTLRAHTDAVTGIAFSPDGTALLTGSTDRTARLWNISTGQPRGEPFLGHTDALIAVAFSPDGKIFYTRSLDGTVRSWDAASGKPLSVLTVPE